MSRQKFKVGDRVEFTFAGSLHQGEITKVKKDGKKITYTVIDEKYTYPVLQEKVIKKL